MTLASDQPVTSSRKASPSQVHQYTGEVVYLYAFDVAYELARKPIPQLLGQPVAQFVVDASKRSPRQLFFYRPQMVRLPPLERLGPRGPVRVERSIKLLPIGAISIMIRVPFTVGALDELVAFHDLSFSTGTWLYDEVRALAAEVQRELQPYLIRPTPTLTDEEAYTVFCIHGPLKSPDGTVCAAEDWLIENRRRVGALLTEEPDPGRLSDQEATESTGKYLSYYDRDLVVIDWDAALVIDEPRFFDETLYLMELANVQLAELEAYDRMLDNAVESSYRDVSLRRFAWGRPTRSSGNSAKSASTWRVSATSCPTSPSSSATGIRRAFIRPYLPAFTWATGTARSTKSSKHWTTCINCWPASRTRDGCSFSKSRWCCCSLLT